MLTQMKTPPRTYHNTAITVKYILKETMYIRQYMSETLYESVSRILELLDMNGNTKAYQDKAKLLDPEERATLKRLKAKHALRQYRAKKQTGAVRTNTIGSHTTSTDENRSSLDGAATTTTQTLTVEELDEYDEPLAPIDTEIMNNTDQPDKPLTEPLNISRDAPKEPQGKPDKPATEYFDISRDAPEEPADIQTTEYINISGDAHALEEPQDIPTIDLQFSNTITETWSWSRWNRLAVLEDRFPDNNAIAAAREDLTNKLISLAQIANESYNDDDDTYCPDETTPRKRRQKRRLPRR